MIKNNNMILEKRTGFRYLATIKNSIPTPHSILVEFRAWPILEQSEMQFVRRGEDRCLGIPS